MKKEISYFFSGIVTAAIVFAAIMYFAANGKAAPQSTPENKEQPPFAYITTPPLPESLTFAGEKVNLDKWYIRERLEREIINVTYAHSLTLMTLKRSSRWFPMIEKIFSENGIPNDMKYLALAESNLTNAISPAKAVGYWQILEKTGRQFGLIIDKEVDQRYDPERATHAAVRYLKHAHATLGNWVLAAASYNAGISGINKRVSTQDEEDYFDLHLHDETLRYIFRAIAYKLVSTQPEKYGFILGESDYYPPHKTYEIEVTGTVDSWVDFAKAEGITFGALKYYNPWIRDMRLRNAKRNTLAVKIPVQEVR